MRGAAAGGWVADTHLVRACSLELDRVPRLDIECFLQQHVPHLVLHLQQLSIVATTVSTCLPTESRRLETGAHLLSAVVPLVRMACCCWYIAIPCASA